METGTVIGVIFGAVCIGGPLIWSVYYAWKRKRTMTPEQLERWEQAEALGEHDW